MVSNPIHKNVVSYNYSLLTIAINMNKSLV